MMPLSRLFLALAIGSLLVPAPASAQSWRQIYSDSQLNVSVDTSRVSRGDNGAYTVMMRWNYARPRLNEERKQYTRLIQQVQVRCTPTPVRVKRFAHTLYNATGGLVEEARPLTASQVRMMDWERLPTRSEGARVYPQVCRTLAARSASG
jgi:hypothetical protein